MLFSMMVEEFFVVFPEGDVQEVSGRIALNQIVDINGGCLALPLMSNRIIAFRVAKVRTKETKGLCETYHYLELLSAQELLEYCR